MPQPGLTLEILNIVFQALYNEVAGAPANLMTRKALQTAAAQYDKQQILSCLIAYVGDDLIRCSRGGVDFTPKDQNKDYDEFHLTSRGMKSTSPYRWSPEKNCIIVIV
jgi:hypothetical protein